MYCILVAFVNHSCLHLFQVNIPKSRKTFCKGKKCRRHTLHKVTQYKKGKDSLYAQGKEIFCDLKLILVYTFCSGMSCAVKILSMSVTLGFFNTSHHMEFCSLLSLRLYNYIPKHSLYENNSRFSKILIEMKAVS